MDGFCLMAGSTRQEDACEKSSSLNEECEEMVISFGGDFSRGSSLLLLKRMIAWWPLRKMQGCLLAYLHVV